MGRVIGQRREATGAPPAAGALLDVVALDRAGVLVTGEGALVRFVEVTPRNPRVMGTEEQLRVGESFAAMAGRLRHGQSLQFYVEASPVLLGDVLKLTVLFRRFNWSSVGTVYFTRLEVHSALWVNAITSALVVNPTDDRSRHTSVRPSRCWLGGARARGGDCPLRAVPAAHRERDFKGDRSMSPEPGDAFRDLAERMEVRRAMAYTERLKSDREDGLQRAHEDHDVPQAIGMDESGFADLDHRGGHGPRVSPVSPSQDVAREQEEETPETRRRVRERIRGWLRRCSATEE